ncbi:MAG TPA: CHAP domain-containing protein [Burkholderiales bacterium]|nr:CHAP domain-containing protein [Burkholderiales bacterium]
MRVICVAIVLAFFVGAPTVSRAEDRPELCPPHDWCGCWLATYLGIKDQKQRRELWVARNWASYGRPADGPAPGVIAVYAYAKGGHVGLVTAVRQQGYVVLKSGNDNGAVRERERSTVGVIAWRIPR